MSKSIISKAFDFILVINLFPLCLWAQSNAAPSMHLTTYFPSNDAILKMQKVKIVNSAYASYFEVNDFTDGYAGLQQTPDTEYGNSNILISSLWDPNTALGIYSNIEYNDSATVTSRFGGEGNGWKTINPYGWQLNTWYNLVNRSWKSNGRLYIATFINNLSTSNWFHTATISIPDPNSYLGGYNDAFLENWDGSNAAWDGRFVRKAFFKDCWNINTSGLWEKNYNAYVSINTSSDDSIRNGIYNNSFNSFYDSTEDAYCMQHGGNSTPSIAFNGGRTLYLPLQMNQGDLPTTTTGQLKSVNVQYVDSSIVVHWIVDDTKSPQWAVGVEIIDSLGHILVTKQDTIPQRRSDTITGIIASGSYSTVVKFEDIFNQYSDPVRTNFNIPPNTPTPVTIKSVNATQENKTITINWQTATELNTSHFIIQHSTTGTSFTNIGNVKAIGSGANSYQFMDTHPANGTNYYRLQSVDKDGGVSYSKIVSYQLSVVSNQLTVFPNPARDNVTISGNHIASVQVIDNMGRVVKTVALHDATNPSVSVGSLPAGVYHLHIQTTDGSVNGIGFVKE